MIRIGTLVFFVIFLLNVGLSCRSENTPEKSIEKETPTKNKPAENIPRQLGIFIDTDGRRYGIEPVQIVYRGTLLDGEAGIGFFETPIIPNYNFTVWIVSESISCEKWKLAKLEWSEYVQSNTFMGPQTVKGKLFTAADDIELSRERLEGPAITCKLTAKHELFPSAYAVHYGNIGHDSPVGNVQTMAYPFWVGQVVAPRMIQMEKTQQVIQAKVEKAAEQTTDQEAKELLPHLSDPDLAVYCAACEVLQKNSDPNVQKLLQEVKSIKNIDCN